jgi:enterochelin esterase family protein
MEPVAGQWGDGSDPGGPPWLRLPSAAGEWRDLGLPGGLQARVWSPAVPTSHVLVAHDGPDYDRRASLGRYAAAGLVPPFHLVLLPAGDRLEWYAASTSYTRLLTARILPRLAAELGTGEPVVGVGASLGALAMLHAQRRAPDLFAGLFLQSGSFFQPRYDKQESGFARYLAIVRFVGKVLRAADGPAVPVAMTCGADEENLANNRGMAGALLRQGYPMTFAENRGGHDWTEWRDALDPHLTTLLQKVWP